MRGGPANALKTVVPSSLSQRRGGRERGKGAPRTEGEAAVARLAQVRDGLVPAAGHVDIPHGRARDDVEAVVACALFSPVSPWEEAGSRRGRERAPFGETLTVPAADKGADATQNTFCSLQDVGSLLRVVETGSEGSALDPGDERLGYVVVECAHRAERTNEHGQAAESESEMSPSRGTSERGRRVNAHRTRVEPGGGCECEGCAAVRLAGETSE